MLNVFRSGRDIYKREAAGIYRVKEEDVTKMFAAVVAKFGRVDLLFNNAGVSIPYTLPGDMSGETWRQAVGVNLHGQFYCLSHAFKQMQTQTPQGGRIINNGSISAHVPRPNAIAYGAAKHAITGLSKSLSLDGRAFDIACGQIDIGNADSPMAGRMRHGVPQANGTIAIEPTIDLCHVVDAVLYMAGLPLTANVPTLTVMATQMPYVGRG